MSKSLDYERIYLNSSKAAGRFRIAQSGLGWKAASTGGSAKAEPFLLPSEEVSAVQWSRGSRGFELRVQTKNKGVIRLDGFDTQDYNQLKNELQRLFNVQLDHKEHSLRGWNWGNTDFARNELVFQINGKPSFEIPYQNINNTNLAGKNEVAVDLNILGNQDTAGDELVEVRFYIPGTVSNETVAVVKNEEGEEVEEEVEEEISAATVFYDQLKEKADIGQVSGDAIASFTDILFLTPRGRFDIDFYSSSLRLRGKTYDHKIQYQQIERIFSLPKPDDIHHLMVIQINPPLRQGQTPYPYLVLQVSKDEELELEVNLEEEEFKSKYEGKLKKRYDQQTHLVLSHVFRGLSDRRIIIPGSFTSVHGQAAVSCSLKVNEGYLYLLEKSLLFVTKPTLYIPYSDISKASISRAGDSTTSNRTFDLEVILRTGGGHKFANINKEEQNAIEFFLKEKKVFIVNEDTEQQARISSALGVGVDDDSDDSDVNMGSADEDESPDEDFSGSDADSDVAEEFDSDAAMSESDGEGEGEGGEPPQKKSKN
jgi:structure-specific recognition protein 1